MLQMNRMLSRLNISRLTLGVMIILVLMLPSCKSESAPDMDIGPLFDEAKGEAQKFWDSSFAKCGDSYYGVYTFKGQPPEPSKWLYQLRETTIITVPSRGALTEADKLNGVEWQGQTAVLSKAYRQYTEGKWTDWFDGTPVIVSDSLNESLRKVKGKWIFSEGRARFTKINCSQIPR